MITDLELYRKAALAAARAYAPYSDYHVGAAVLASSGRVYVGANIENASYGATICAERAAVSKAVFEGEKNITAIAVAAYAGTAGSDAQSGAPAYPCGICRQFLSEFGGDIRVIVGADEEHLERYTISELLPKAFTNGFKSDTGLTEGE
ncbi:cytidine deaminase [Clostridia bacterium]|nr:cytidine deaminase [Clostridia bacterium]